MLAEVELPVPPGRPFSSTICRPRLLPYRWSILQAKDEDDTDFLLLREVFCFFRTKLLRPSMWTWTWVYVAGGADGAECAEGRSSRKRMGVQALPQSAQMKWERCR